MRMFVYQEYHFYLFGLKLGFANLLRNRFTLGFKKTLGKITQPINSYTRFPEYFYMATKIKHYLAELPPDKKVKVLDIGSPKCLGMYLAHKYNVEVHLTDISPLNIDEYSLMWNAIKKNATGSAFFSLRDARNLKYETDSFDVVYAMSVIEHISGDDGDRIAIGEMLRVLKPGGVLLISVPFGMAYIEQQRIGYKGAAERTKANVAFFFQRIYDRVACEQRLLASAPNLQNLALIEIWRSHLPLAGLYGKFPEQVRGALGFLNPLFSAIINRSQTGMTGVHKNSYGKLFSSSDVYGDLLIVGQKNGAVT